MTELFSAAIFALGIGLSAISSGDVVLDSSLGKSVSQCHSSSDKAKKVWIFKQWHLAPSVDTHSRGSQLPQQENQRAIFQQIEKWVEKGDVTTVYSEGCAGELGESFSKKFNGWTLKDLSAAAKDKDFDDIVTLIPMKVKAKFQDKVHVHCAD